MNKIRSVFFIVVGVIVCYVFLIVCHPVIREAVDTSAATIQTNADYSTTKYPGAIEGLQAAPWVIFFVPAGVGGVALVLVLKRRNKE
ncbi:MAG: hypothetical protein PHU23_12865 [Dehalococcoidales bacterium]|nr:hypothetical protein [Dehalococcoidales bacterium]